MCTVDMFEILYTTLGTNGRLFYDSVMCDGVGGAYSSLWKGRVVVGGGPVPNGLSSL